MIILSGLERLVIFLTYVVVNLLSTPCVSSVLLCSVCVHLQKAKPDHWKNQAEFVYVCHSVTVVLPSQVTYGIRDV